MRAVRLALVLAVLVLGLTPALVRAAGPFALPVVSLDSPTCAIFDAACTLTSGPVSTSFGTFRLNVLGDPGGSVPPASGNGWCMPLSGSSTLTFGSSTDQLALAGGTLCYTQPTDSAGAPSPPQGPWPLQLTFVVDPLASTGIYAGATGTGAIDGTWTTSVSCKDSSGNPIMSCGLSGEALANFTLASVSLPELTIPGGGGGCTVGCGGGGGGGGGGIPDATPELDSVTMFASGLVGLGGYVLLRRRARGSS
jgi:hypothetical protein